MSTAVIAGRTLKLKPERHRFSAHVESLTQEIYGCETPAVLEALTCPVSTYYVRCNTLKISPNGLMARLTERGLHVSQHPTIPEALGIKVDGPFDVQGYGREVIVDKLTSESVLQGANVYAPGVANCERVNFGDEVAVISEMGDLLATGIAQMSTHEILNFRKGLAVRIEQRRYRAPQIRELPEYSEGLLYPQSLAAMVASRVLDPQPGETILDMNCAPGGKLSHICQLIHNSGRIIGLDRSAEKVDTTRGTITTLGCANASISIQDSRYADVDFKDLDPHRVMVDPPCSALGLRPKIYDDTTQDRVHNLAAYQKQFLKAAGRLVRPGGTVVYSVCTYTRNECEEVVDFTEKECGLHLVQQLPLLAPTMNQKAVTACQRFHPVRDEIGYFIAKFER